jgi:exodeoxyribonuclease VII large subunit
MQIPLDSGGIQPVDVSELTGRIKTALEEHLPECWVIGEMSQYTHHSSGHRYFTLKDSGAQLSCVMFKWQGQQLSFEPETGAQVLVWGRVSLYERGGRYQFYVSHMQPAGVGELARAFERLKTRLEAEGLFDPERKRPLPPFPQRIGIVTSPTGAAIRDIIHVLGRRAPGVQLVLAPARVQGPGAAAEIATAIENLNSHGQVDILIVGRGGGSPEDLWPFNEEITARAIYQSAKPVISAVGHEVDYTIADYVADYRAATPSAAAEIVAQEHGELRRRVVDLRRRLHTAIRHRTALGKQQLRAVDPQRLLKAFDDHLRQTDQYADERRQQLATAFDALMRHKNESFGRAVLRLETLNPLAGLARGFAFCEDADSRQPVRNAAQLAPAQRLRLRFHQGQALCRVEEIEDE